MVTKLTSIKTIIAKLIADLDLQEKDIKISDCIEWAGEAIEKIGAVTQFIPKVATIPFNCHQAPIPCDLHQLHQIAYSYNCNGPWFPMRKATGSFAVWGDSECKECECLSPDILINDDAMVNLVVDMYGNIDKTKAIEMINTNQNLRTILSNLINQHTYSIHDNHSRNTLNSSLGIQYSVKPGWIMCNLRNGFLKVSYSAIPTDEDSYPLIPDLISYKEAIYWYITMKFKYPEYLAGSINREIYYDIRRSWNFYRQQAYAEAIMPNEDGLESIKNNWNKIMPEYRDHSTFYSHTGERQVIYNHNV